LDNIVEYANFLVGRETETVEFNISEDDLRFFDPVRHAWVSEKGKYEILLGTSAADIMYTLDFDLK
jgi:beta-glucosidase